jgi:hypothetical protein
MAIDLMLGGYTVWEVLAIFEVIYLCEHQNVDVVVIGPEAELRFPSVCNSRTSFFFRRLFVAGCDEITAAYAAALSLTSSSTATNRATSEDSNTPSTPRGLKSVKGDS